MKRFFCTICKRVKRVRSLPRNVVNSLAESAVNRVGSCDKHDSSFTPVVPARALYIPTNSKKRA